MDATANHAKLRCFFNPPAPVPLDEGLNRTAEYVLSHGRFHPTGFEKIEIWDKMPRSWVGALKEWKSVIPIISVSLTNDNKGRRGRHVASSCGERLCGAVVASGCAEGLCGGVGVVRVVRVGGEGRANKEGWAVEWVVPGM